MPSFALLPHPDSPPSPVNAITVTAERRAGDALRLVYTVAGDVDAVAWPMMGLDGPDPLWQHSCFEAFVGPAGAAGYIELNLATSFAWAAYGFTGYRARGATPEVRVGEVAWRPTSAEAMFVAGVRLPSLVDAAVWRLALSTVIEATDGGKSFWALAHAPGQPDFHADAAFVATLAAPH